MKRRILTFEKAKQRFCEREDIELIEFYGWKKKAKFFDKIVKDCFWAIPDNVFRLKSVHPKRRKEKTILTNLKKYGTENPAQNEHVKNKIKKTNLKRYGVTCSLSNKKIRSKSEQTNLQKLGVNNPLAAATVREKIKDTLLEKYGIEYPLQNKEVQKRTEATNIRKYGVRNVAQIKYFREKMKRTCVTKYGVENISQLDYIKQTKKEKKAKYFVYETNETFSDWLLRQPEPKPSYSFLQQLFKKTNQAQIDEQELLNLCEQYKTHKTNIEIFVENLLKVEHFNKKLSSLSRYYRPDFKLSPQIFLNVDGLYWHSGIVQSDKWYHFKLRQEFEKNGLRIFQFREDEIRDKPKIVKSIVSNAIGKTKNKIYARRCRIEKVKQVEAIKFLKDNHLMGSTNAKHVGLYLEEQLVSLLSYKQRKNICKIERFCSIVDCNVVGGFSKLLKYLEQHCLKSNITEIHNWVDLRYGTGKHLENKGFMKMRDTLGWKWTNFKETFNRLKCRAKIDKRQLTQQQHADELGWHKIYDAGQRLFSKSI